MSIAMAQATAKDKQAKAAPKTAGKATKKAAPAAAEGERCSVDKCKQTARAKGLCRKHYMGWRRGKVGNKHRYKVCSKEGCRKPGTIAGRCEEHKKVGKAAGEAAAA